MAEFPVDVVRLVERGSDPGATASSGKYYTKDVAGVTKWFYQASNGTVSELAAGLVAAPNSIEYQHLTNITVIGPHTLSSSAPSTTPIQPVFAPGNDTVSLAANTTYKVKGLYAFENADALSTTDISFSGGTIGVGFPGDASINLIAYTTFESLMNSSAPNGTPESILWIEGSSTNTWTVFPNNSTFYKVLRFEGMLKTVSAGTFVPRIQWIGTGGGGGPILQRKSYLELIPVGGSSFDTAGQG